ncbi:YodL domain-containing protein [Candidatus Merdisoma sp. JLR.KK006]|uniref:YodL domain-containing protein n=1 Tax=Candidatus Merdisoma sp. JLR.KK006 TaxID=3112626 RepID=UPI002FF389F7
MADARTEKQKVKEITDRLEEGLKELFEGEKYKSYLNTMSKFHNYSANNIQLIEMQCPDATYVAGYKAWQRNFERHVNKGERGIRILAPAPYKIKEEQEKIDPVTNEPVLDRDGMPVMEEVEIKIPAFRVVTVFDYSQTDGKELPGLGVSELHGDVERYQDFMEALERVSPVPIRYEEMEGDRKGYFIDLSRPIAIKEGMSEAQTAKTGVHEVAHAKLHAREIEHETGFDKDRETKEVEAESVAYTVCQHFGIDTSDYSFGYIAGWSSGKEMPELKSSLDTIRRTSSELIKGIEAQLLEIEKERAAEQSQEDIILLVSNTDRSEYDLLNVKGMERTEIFNLLSAMKDDDRQSVEAYLERAGAWVTLLANERSEEVGEYHLDYAYDTDTHEITDYKALQEEREKANIPIEYGDVVVRFSTPDSGEYETIKITNMQSEVQNTLYDILMREVDGQEGTALDYLREKGFEFVPIMRSGGLNDGYPQFFDYDMDMTEKELYIASELPATVQAEQLINRMEFHRSVYDSDERNLIMNHAYKLDDMYKTTSLAHSIAEQKDDSALLWETIRVAQEEIDALPDGMVGLSEMHEYGYSWDEMLPLTKDMASELFGEDVSVYQLHADGSETLVEDRAALQEHEGLFGVEKGDWNAYKEYQSMKQELEDSEPNKEAQLLYGNESKFGIYQLKDSAETRDIRFMDMDYLEKEGIPVSRENYTLVYTGELKEGMSLENIYTKFNIDHPADFTGHSLSVSDVVVLHQDGENTSHYVDSVGYREIPEFTKELSISAEISKEEAPVMDKAAEMPENTVGSGIQGEPGTDRFTYYVIEDLSARVGSNPEKGEVERFDNLSEAIAKFKECREREDADQTGMTKAVFGFGINGKEFDVLHVKNNQNCVPIEFTQNGVENSQFKSELQALYQEVGFDRAEVYRERTPEETKDMVKELLEVQLKTSGINDVSLYMDRFDTLYEQGKMEHLIPEGEQNRILENIPFTEWKNPYIDASAREADRVETEIQEEKQTVVTLTVAECGEFHNFGEYHEGIAGIEEAIAIFNRIPPERMNGIPSIGINIHTEGTESYEDTQIDIVSGRVADLEILDYVPDITDNPKAVEVIAELIDKLPDLEVRGSLEKWQAAFLAAEIDQLSYNYDTVQYNQTVEDREAQIANITEDIRNGNTGYLNDFLNALISDSIREGMTDIIGKGTELDGSEGVQTARKAKELLDKLAEYKPLAKIEELEECNYNMIDNVLNNEKPKEEKQTGRISIKEKLAEKKAVIEQRDKSEKEVPEKGTEKKSEREI